MGRYVGNPARLCHWLDGQHPVGGTAIAASAATDNLVERI
jgi:hypothetical protein